MRFLALIGVAVSLLTPRPVPAQERARDAPFSCEPIAPSSVVFLGVALESYVPAAGERHTLRFKVKESFFGVRPTAREFEVALETDDPIAAGEERIVSSYPDESGPHWAAETFDEEKDKLYLANLRSLMSGNRPARLVGWTSGPDGAPLPNVAVQAIGSAGIYEVKSSEKGTFELAGLPPGNYRVAARRSQYQTAVPFEQIEILPGACGVVSFLFTFHGAIQGTVRDVRGNPLQGVHVDLQGFADDQWFIDQTAATNAEGRYSFGDLAPGCYRAGVNLRGRYDPYPVLYAPSVEDSRDALTITIGEAEPMGLADFWLPDLKLRRFQIQVFWADGQPAPGARIGLIFGRWHDTGDVHADERGSVAVQGYAMLQYRLYAYGRRSGEEQELASRAVLINEGDQDVSIALVLTTKHVMGETPSPFDK